MLELFRYCNFVEDLYRLFVFEDRMRKIKDSIRERKELCRFNTLGV